MNGFEKAVRDTCLLVNKCDASTEFAQKHNIKCKTFYDEVSTGKPGHQNGHCHFKQTVFYVIGDTIRRELNTRFENFRNILFHFASE